MTPLDKNSALQEELEDVCYYAVNRARLIELVRGGLSVNFRYHTGFTPLTLHCMKGDADFVEFLLSLGADVNYPDAAGRTAMQIVRDKGNSHIVRLLISAGAR